MRRGFAFGPPSTLPGDILGVLRGQRRPGREGFRRPPGASRSTSARSLRERTLWRKRQKPVAGRACPGLSLRPGPTQAASLIHEERARALCRADRWLAEAHRRGARPRRIRGARDPAPPIGGGTSERAGSVCRAPSHIDHSNHVFTIPIRLSCGGRKPHKESERSRRSVPAVRLPGWPAPGRYGPKFILDLFGGGD